MAQILLIEDSLMVQQVVKNIVEPMGHRLFVSGTVRNALAMVEGGKADLILLDLNLPDARGEDVVRAVRQQMKLETPIVVLSGEIKVDTVVSLKPLNVAGFVAKASDFESRVAEEVDKVLGNEAGISDSLPI